VGLVVENPAAKGGPTQRARHRGAAGEAVGNGQAGDGHGRGALDVEDPAGVVAADGQLRRARPLDVHAVVDQELAQCQGDGLAVELLGELDGVAAAGGGDHRAQRAGGAIVGGAGDGQRAGHGAVFQRFEPEPETGPRAAGRGRGRRRPPADWCRSAFSQFHGEREVIAVAP
jgi:hypothetical protein